MLDTYIWGGESGFQEMYFAIADYFDPEYGNGDKIKGREYIIEGSKKAKNYLRYTLEYLSDNPIFNQLVEKALYGYDIFYDREVEPIFLEDISYYCYSQPSFELAPSKIEKVADKGAVQMDKKFNKVIKDYIEDIAGNTFDFSKRGDKMAGGGELTDWSRLKRWVSYDRNQKRKHQDYGVTYQQLIQDIRDIDNREDWKNELPKEDWSNLESDLKKKYKVKRLSDELAESLHRYLSEQYQTKYADGGMIETPYGEIPDYRLRHISVSIGNDEEDEIYEIGFEDIESGFPSDIKKYINDFILYSVWDNYPEDYEVKLYEVVLDDGSFFDLDDLGYYESSNEYEDGGYVVRVFEGKDAKDYWKGNDENEAYDQFINARAENIKQNDVVLYQDEDEIDVYDAMEDLEQDDEYGDGGGLGEIYSIGDASNKKLLADIPEKDYIKLLDDGKIVNINDLNDGYSYYHATDKEFEEEIKSKGSTYEGGGAIDNSDYNEVIISLLNETGEEFDEIDDNISGNILDITMESGAEYRVYLNEDDAYDDAVERVTQDAEENLEYFNKDFVMRHLDSDIDKFFREVYDEMNVSYANDIKLEGNHKYDNRLIEEMVMYGLMSKSDAESGEASEIAEDRIDDFVETLTSDQMTGGDGTEFYKDQFGEDELYKLLQNNNLIDIDSLSQDAVATDGIGHFISSYDGNMIYLDNGEVAFRTN